jgi:phosphoribosylanthranilate isomerase
MSVKLKICGIQTLSDAQSCSRLGVDMLGFNFFPDSPRYISPHAAKKIINKIPLTTICIGILVKPTLVEVLNVIKTSRIQAVQIYQPQDFEDFSEIPVPVIKVMRISDWNNKKIALGNANMILLDTYSADAYGGSGVAFNWDLIPGSISKERLILAGGITTENAAAAVQKVNPAVIDVASGAEMHPGKKDLEKVKRLLEEIKRTA